jgi:hypothetical protein
MAKFIANSTGTQALRLNEIDGTQFGITFETGATVEAVQALAVPVMAALEA